MHQEAFARFQLGAIEDIGPYREEGFRDRRAADGVIAFGQAQAVESRCGAIFRIAAAWREGHDLIADFPATGVASRGDDRPGDFQAWQIGSTWWRRIIA